MTKGVLLHLNRTYSSAAIFSLKSLCLLMRCKRSMAMLVFFP